MNPNKLWLFAPVDSPWTPKHMLWHFIHAWAMLLDGVLCVLALGLRFPGFSAYITNGGLNWLYDHNEAFGQQEKDENAQARIHLGVHVLGLTEEQCASISEDELHKMLMKKVRSDVEEVLGSLDRENAPEASKDMN